MTAAIKEAIKAIEDTHKAIEDTHQKAIEKSN